MSTLKQIILISLIMSFSVAFISCRPSIEVYDLKCEGMAEPLGIDSASPHFSWKIRSAKPMEQVYYEIQVAGSLSSLKSGEPDLWSSGKEASADQVMVPYSGKPLVSRQQCCWRVRVWKSDKKVSRWSEPRRFGIGIIGDDAMRGDYIGAVPGDLRASLLRKSFEVESLPSMAILYVNSLGYHEAYINGKKVSEAVLSPAVSQLDKRSLIMAYDVTSLLKKGGNEIVLWAGTGWYKVFKPAYDGPLVKAELDAVTPSGVAPILCTDASWKGAWSGYRDLTNWRYGGFGGESIDASVAPESLDSQSLDQLVWAPVDVVKIEGIMATQQMCEPCVVHEVLAAKSIKPNGEGSWVVDFGRIVNGLLDIKLPQLPEGHQSTASFADFQETDGTFKPVSRNEYISSGNPDGDRFLNRFNHHVFRYVILDSIPEAPKLEDIMALRMRTDFKPTSSFKSSDDELNMIHDMVRYTMENLAFDGYMVDCANLERLGYGGDGNASTLSLQIMYDVAPLYANWLQAWNDVIREDGGLPHTAPTPWRAGGGPYWCGFIVQAPWRTYMSYGDKRLIERCYPTMRHWLDYVDAYTVDGLLKEWPETEYRHWFLGDWAAPDGVDVRDPESVDLVNNCSLCQVYLDLVQIARLLGKESDAAEFQARYAALSKVINDKLFHPESSTYASGSQIDMAYPMLVGIVPDNLRKQVRDKLLERTSTEYDGYLKTGLVGVPVITEWATLAGECDFMYGMLKKHGYPGYLHMLDNGATGTWEHWNARRSRLHNCFNGIGSWFYQALGGIIPDAPGYRHVRIAPQIPEGLESVKVRQRTPYGDINVSRNGRNLHFELPVGVTATVAGKEYSCGKYDIEL